MCCYTKNCTEPNSLKSDLILAIGKAHIRDRLQAERANRYGVPFGAITEEHFDKLFNINVRGTLFTVQKALPLLKDGGSIILNGSVASVKGTAAFGVYAASKAAIRSFVRTWTTDLKDRRIRSNVVSPGPINTPLVSRQSADVIGRIVSTIPMGRMGEPEEVAKVALFLASDDSSFVTGIELFVDGGRAQI
jgi:NAD(P)-dependent dehydrogenase (short-subunit alcohol dehydrogenase family)